jgi:hypothetical protein
VVADAVGDLFGWVDDLTDLRVDALTRQPNSALPLIGYRVADGLDGGLDEAHLRRLEDETTDRWDRLLSVVSDAGLGDDRLRHGLALSLMSWLG